MGSEGHITKTTGLTHWLRNQCRRVTRCGRRREVIVRRLVWALACITILAIWNGRRIANAVIAPFRERIRHYTDLHSARTISLSVVVAYLARSATKILELTP